LQIAFHFLSFFRFESQNGCFLFCFQSLMKFIIGFCLQCELSQESGVAELISAMAAGWNANFIVETWSKGGIMATSIGLSVASRHTGGRHVCIVPDEQSRLEYVERMVEASMTPEVIVGEAEEVMDELVGIDFMVVDCKRKDFARILRLAKLSSRGAVLVCKNASLRTASSFKWRSVLDGRSRRLVRSVFLPVGMGLDIAHVAASGGNSGSSSSSSSSSSRWIKHIDQQSGEEHVIRKVK
jgi:predicted O-methyltransferase YrrM